MEDGDSKASIVPRGSAVMAKATECEYVVLTSSAGSKEPRPVAVVIRGCGRWIGIHTRKLRKSSSDPQVGYLTQLFRSWKRTPAADQEAFFAEILELSAEPLFAEKIGSCAMSELPRIISAALGGDGSSQRALLGSLESEHSPPPGTQGGPRRQPSLSRFKDAARTRGSGDCASRVDRITTRTPVP